jgi:hypothetical protein
MSNGSHLSFLIRNLEVILESQGFAGSTLRDYIHTKLESLVEEKLQERKKHISAMYYSSEQTDDQEETGEDLQVIKREQLEVIKQDKGNASNDDDCSCDHSDNDNNDSNKFSNKNKKTTEELDEAKKKKSRNVQKMGRLKIIRIRIRGGKVQRRKKLSAVKGFTLRGGKVKRISPVEKRHRKMGARRAKFKRRAKQSRIRTKLRRSLRRRKSLGY